ncbi:hypothetical protein AB1Y20_016128 [Prymnesium parvum]|uniref:Uncharacterized protein n=1 Tax=Prymnesium parvum TaxID=97485 RepID=A0AB34JZ38_PRYPA
MSRCATAVPSVHSTPNVQFEANIMMGFDSKRMSMAVDADVSMLNPNAPVFVPSYAHALMDPTEARHIDHAMACFHHLATVNDTETLNQAKGWLGEDPSLWFVNGMDYTCPDGAMLDELTAHLCDREDSLRDHLYCPPRRPKGDTRGRAKPRR